MAGPRKKPRRGPAADPARSRAAKKAAKTRAASLAKKKRSEAAKKGARTKARKAAEREALRKARSRRSKAAWERKKILHAVATTEKKSRSGLRRQAVMVLKDLLARLDLDHWKVVSERYGPRGGTARATGFGDEPVEPSDVMVLVNTRYDRTVQALTPKHGKTFEAAVAVRIQSETFGEMWAHLVSLTDDPEKLIYAFDAGWENLPEKMASGRVKSVPEGPVDALQVYFIEHR